jgi:hypothetical protein
VRLPVGSPLAASRPPRTASALRGGKSFLVLRAARGLGFLVVMAAS